jgi:hypothetical protein
MNPVFMAAVQAQGGTTFPIRASSSVPGTIPANIRPPGAQAPAETTGAISLASTESRPVPAPGASGSGNLFSGLFSSSADGAKGNDSTKASAGAAQQSGGGVLDRMSRLVGLGGGSDQSAAETTASAKAKPAKSTQAATASAATARPKTATTPATTTPAAATALNQADAKSTAGKPSAQADAQQEAVNTANLLRGAQTPVPAGSFDSRWGSPPAR